MTKNTILIEAETEAIKNTFITFLTNYKIQITQFMNQVLGNDGTPTDASLEVEGDAVKLYQIAPDKGWVIGKSNDDGTIQLMQYASVKDGATYVIPEDARLCLYIKEENGPDAKIGAFKTLSDAVMQFNSKEVEEQVTNYANFKAAKAKEAKKIERKKKEHEARVVELLAEGATKND